METGPILGSAPGGRLLPDFEQALVDLLAREIDVGLVAENRGHLGEAVARKRAGVFKAGGAGQRGFDAER